MAKRANHEGSIYKRSDGRWIGAVTLPNTGGARKYYSGMTRAAVQAKIKKATDRVNGGRRLLDERLTVGAFLADWLDAVQPPRLRPKTWLTYRSYINVHLIPGIGHHRLVALAPSHVEKFLHERVQHGLKPISARRLRNILSAALADAERDELVDRNVAKLARGPKVATAEIQPFTPEEAAQLVQGMRTHRLQGLFLVMLGLGLRHGEALALTWADVDLEAETPMIHVRRSLERWQGEDRLVELLKTARSRRSLPLPQQLALALRLHERRQQGEGEAAGQDVRGRSWFRNDLNLVFTSELGLPLSEAHVGREFHALLEQLGLPRRRVYDLRHSAASFLINAGADLRSLMEQLGHSNISMTANVYSHIYMERKKQMADTMDGVLRTFAGEGG